MSAQDKLTELKDIENSLAIFCMATYGEGDPTDNAQEFFEFLTNGEEELNGLKFAVSFLLAVRFYHVISNYYAFHYLHWCITEQNM